MGGGKLILFWLFITSGVIYALNKLNNKIAWIVFGFILGLYALVIAFKLISQIED